MAFQLVRKKIYPRVHSNFLKFGLYGADNSTQSAFHIPAVMQDEGLGDPNSAYTNPQSASFAEYQGPNTYPDSRVNRATINLELTLSKGAVETDKVQVMKVGIMPVNIAFLESLTAKNEVTSEEVEDVLELQHEDTDRQTYPLWNGTKANGDNLETGSAVPGLTTNTNLEAVTFDVDKYYDSLQYYTNQGKIRKATRGIKWLYVSRNRTLRVRIRMTSTAKAQNPYTYFGAFVCLPQEDEFNFSGLNGDLTGIAHVVVKATYRYNEWNENFNFMR